MNKIRLFVIAITVAVIVSLAGGMAFADDRSDAVAKKNKAATEEQKSRSALEGVNKELANAVIALENAQKTLDGAQSELDDAKSFEAGKLREQQNVTDQLQVAQNDLKKVDTQLQKSTKQAEESRSGIGELARKTYRGSGSLSVIELATTAKTTEDFAEASQLAEIATQIQNRELVKVETIVANDRNNKARKKALKDQISDLKDRADEAVKAAAAATNSKREKVEEFEAAKSKQQASKDDLESKKSTLEADIARKQEEQRQAEAKIAEIDEANRAATSGGTARPRGGNSGTGGGSGGYGGGGIFRSPINSGLYITSPYGYRIHPTLGYGAMHQGVDLASPCGENQYAAAAGTVYGAYYDGSGGNTIYINHGMIGGNSWITVYRHLSVYGVGSGARVSRGGYIGKTGATGTVTGCHVHFEIWKNGSTINPMSML